MVPFIDLCLNFRVFASLTVVPRNDHTALLYRFVQRRGQVAPIAAKERPELCVENGLGRLFVFL